MRSRDSGRSAIALSNLNPCQAGLVYIAPDSNLWVSVSSDALGITSLCVSQSYFLGKISLAVRNRSYTTETRLRGLKKHEGKFHAVVCSLRLGNLG
jgi:hypothetical protein